MADPGILAARAEIEQQIAGRTICGQLAEVASRHPDAPAYSDPDGDGWRTLSYGQARERVLRIAAGFAAIGVEPGDVVAIMMVNRSEHVLTDLGAVHAGATPCTIYSTFSPEQVAFIAADVRAKVAVLGGPDDLERWRPILGGLPGLRKVIVLDGCPEGEPYLSWDAFLELGRERLAAAPREVADRWRAVRADDVLTVLYTSGTTGNPKGVPLTHANVFFEVVSTDRLTLLPERGRQISYLTYAHIAERVLSLYLPLFKVSHVYFCPEMERLGAVLGQVRPVLFFGVPRVWEKIMARLQAVLATQPEERQAEVRRAMAAGLAYVEACQYGHAPTPEIEEAYRRADAALLAPIRSLIGLDEARWVVTAAAPLPGEVQRFFAGLGLKLVDVYGMTETTGAFTGNSVASYKLGTVGRPCPGVEVRIAEDGEILTRGPINTRGYLGLPEATAELIDEDGWLHTGDVGSIDEDGFVRVVDRKEGDDHHGRGREHLPGEHREPAQGAPAHRAGARLRGPPAVPGGAAHPRRRDRARLGAGPGHRVRVARRPRRAPRRAQGGRRRGRRRERAPRPGAAGEAVAAAAGRVDGRFRGAHPEHEAQAPRGARAVRRGDRRAVRRRRARRIRRDVTKPASVAGGGRERPRARGGRTRLRAGRGGRAGYGRPAPWPWA